ncbi:MAG: hypothetical protein M3Y48_10130 [Actinomycetota bacterium]|nr:hypothetical protein [Actinomycetota bacterium]
MAASNTVARLADLPHTAVEGTIMAGSDAVGAVIGAYGLLAVLLAEVLIRARDRTLLIMAALWVIPIVVFRTLDSRSPRLPWAG